MFPKQNFFKTSPPQRRYNPYIRLHCKENWIRGLHEGSNIQFTLTAPDMQNM